jgi:hypothetical protein
MITPDTNNMIILYPQAIPDYTIHAIWNGGVLSNPNGCWDWVGWYGSNADQIGGMSPSRVTVYYELGLMNFISQAFKWLLLLARSSRLSVAFKAR